MTENHTEMKHRSVQGPAKYGTDHQAKPTHQESYSIFPFASLLIILYHRIPNHSDGDESLVHSKMKTHGQPSEVYLLFHVSDFTEQ